MRSRKGTECLVGSLLAASLLIELPSCMAPPTPPPTAVSSPTATRWPTATPDPAGYVTSDIPRCDGAKRIDPIDFEWPGIEDVKEADWLYYRCALKPLALSEFYRPKMTEAPYNWLENAWVVLPEGTLGVYFHTARQSWLYLWFVADKAEAAGSYLIAAERMDTPLDLPCH